MPGPKAAGRSCKVTQQLEACPNGRAFLSQFIRRDVPEQKLALQEIVQAKEEKKRNREQLAKEEREYAEAIMGFLLLPACKPLRTDLKFTINEKGTMNFWLDGTLILAYPFYTLADETALPVLKSFMRRNKHDPKDFEDFSVTKFLSYLKNAKSKPAKKLMRLLQDSQIIDKSVRIYIRPPGGGGQETELSQASEEGAPAGFVSADKLPRRR